MAGKRCGPRAERRRAVWEARRRAVLPDRNHRAELTAEGWRFWLSAENFRRLAYVTGARARLARSRSLRLALGPVLP